MSLLSFLYVINCQTMFKYKILSALTNNTSYFIWKKYWKRKKGNNIKVMKKVQFAFCKCSKLKLNYSKKFTIL